MSDTNRAYRAGVNNDITTKQNPALMCPEVFRFTHLHFWKL